MLWFLLNFSSSSQFQFFIQRHFQRIFFEHIFMLKCFSEIDVWKILEILYFHYYRAYVSYGTDFLGYIACFCCAKSHLYLRLFLRLSNCGWSPVPNPREMLRESHFILCKIFLSFYDGVDDGREIQQSKQEQKRSHGIRNFVRVFLCA